VITEGHAEVWQTGLYDDEQKKVATLSVGDSFGEDALVTGGTRNATVRMGAHGRLLVCKKEDFKELVAGRTVKEISSDETFALLGKKGYRLIDVRYEEEYEESYIDGSALVPLSDLRMRLGEFTKDKKYIVYCRSGKRSAVAAMILTRAGVDAVSMAGGIINWPHETKSLY
jgi:rhodanese-related sulfurtransferase